MAEKWIADAVSVVAVSADADVVAKTTKRTAILEAYLEPDQLERARSKLAAKLAVEASRHTSDEAVLALCAQVRDHIGAASKASEASAALSAQVDALSAAPPTVASGHVLATLQGLLAGETPHESVRAAAIARADANVSREIAEMLARALESEV